MTQIGPGEWEMGVVWLDPDRLRPNAENPNQQDDATFNALVRSIETEGWTVPVTAVAAPDGMYDIVAGEHRWRAARVLGCTVPVIPLPAEEFDEDRRAWNLVKDNVITGRLNPEKFARLYERMARKYDPEVLQTLMGFTSSDAFSKVYRATRDALPPALQDALDKAKDEIKTIDDLSTVLNRLFREFGETLPSDFMVFSWAGKDVLWVRASPMLFKTAQGWAEQCAAGDRSFASELETAILEYLSRQPD